jgi:hypothetical protein
MDKAKRACERLRVAMRLVRWLIPLSTVLVCVHPALAEPRFATEEARSFFDRAEADDAARDFARALAEYDAAVAKDPSAPFVPKARARADTLRTHSEGSFAPLERLERVRRDPDLAENPRELEALARDANLFPPGLVRGEARLLVAEAYAGRLQRRTDAVPLLSSVVEDPAADPLLARLALRMLVDAHLAGDDLPAAEEDVAAHPMVADPSVVAYVRRFVRRHRAHEGAELALASLALLTALSLVRARRRGDLHPLRGTLRRAAPRVLLFAVFVAGAGALLASSFEPGSAAPFVALGAAVLPIGLVARAWGAAGSRHAGARIGRAVLSAAAMLGAGFLVLERIDARYLAGFGL